MAERKSFIFYKRYWEAVEHLHPKQKLLAMKAIIEYSLYGDTPMLHGENYGTKAYNAFVSVHTTAGASTPCCTSATAKSPTGASNISVTFCVNFVSVS